MIEHDESKLSVRKQCELLEVNRGSVYYEKEPISSRDVEIMNEMAIIHRETPFYGYRRMQVELATHGYEMNHKKVQRLMNDAELKALYPKKKTTIRNLAHQIYPYLLRGLRINRPNQVWDVDITYIKTRTGYVYLVGLIDVFTRKIMGWCLSPFLDTRACLEALKSALKLGFPEIINSDQGCQFTSNDWISELKRNNIQISMDGKGRWADNVFIERFWRSIKYECLYLHSFETVGEARKRLGDYIVFYNQRRPHQMLDYKTPNSFYDHECKKIAMGKKEVLNLKLIVPMTGPTMGGVMNS